MVARSTSLEEGKYPDPTQCGRRTEAASRGPVGDHAAAGSPLLEYLPNTVTTGSPAPGCTHQQYEVAKDRCDCWFCTDCCSSKGYNLRARLTPILETFKGLMMLTFTVDPTLFDSPKAAYDYLREERCISRTLQDLDRAGHLHTRRYFYVVEFQEKTEQAHSHVLIDASFVPFDALLASWSKHRPKEAGPVQGQRPAFGTVLFSKRDFNNAHHAACYATKYLIKTPDYGYPEWVLEMGAKQRVRRYSTSRGFWNNASKPKSEPKTKRTMTHRSYAQRRAECGQAVHLFALVEMVNDYTGEIETYRNWIGKLAVDSSVLDKLHDEGNPARRRRIIDTPSLHAAIEAIEEAAGHRAEWIGFHASGTAKRADAAAKAVL